MRTLVFLVFAAMFAAAMHEWALPPYIAAAYLACSLVCFGMYAIDKAAAMAGRWRTSENMLLFLGLACGWPGAMAAQHFLRHKSNKTSFKMRFWMTVMLNVALFAYFASPFSVLRQP